MNPKTKLTLSSKEVSEKFSSKMTDLTLRSKEQEAAAWAQQLNMPYINLTGLAIAQDALELIPEKSARQLSLVPFLLNENEVRLGTTNPSTPGQVDYIKQLQATHPAHYVVYVISVHSLTAVLKLYEKLPKIREVTSGVSVSEADIKRYQTLATDFKAVNELLNKASLTDMVTVIIAGGLTMAASDIHVEAEEKDIIVRYRIDGTLYTIAQMNLEIWPKLISRLKLLAKIKINISSTPQDGRFTIYLPEDKIDVRVSTIPTSFGESVVMRLLRSSATGLKFDDLGIRGQAYVDLKREITRPNGMIITTGPTGSGKTTTLYAILNQLNNSATKIITLEDPVEYKLKGVNQSQIDAGKGYDFARGLKAILRQDPDVVMVGEIRDFATADTAINAALTGHLVISTIHTNSAAGAIPRFLAMGVKPFLLTPALNCIMAQRLVRRICENCKIEANLDNATLTKVKKVLDEIAKNYLPKNFNINNLKFYKGQGCTKCNNLGFKGRVGVYEILTLNEEIEKLLLAGQISEYDIQNIATKHGMILMVQDGLLKALDGITSVEEVFSVVE
ncbi:MAG: type II/IV secretion system protein [Candidatus Kerfeldbacteria bacterium]|nr:type II/IV secretion system protein [Candidatus Kerfeldbacteria bacterium]